MVNMMEIIDAHIHWFPEEHARELAARAGHLSTEEHLREQYDLHNITHAIVMGNRSLAPENHVYPGFMSYCVGVDRFSGFTGSTPDFDLIEQNLRRKECVGIKLYPGYNYQYIYDKAYGPLYELAERYRKPVAVHTGATAMPSAKLKYCHPLTLDEAAAEFPRASFIMCHFGNPFIADAAAVISKNPNVCADLSGMLEGTPDMPALLLEQAGYVNHLRTWLAYAGAYERLMFGTDWPLVNIACYIEFVSKIIPQRFWEMVFSGNVMRIYGL